MTEQKPVEYVFIKSIEHQDGWVGMMADKAVLGENGVQALRSSVMTGAFNQMRIRSGVHFMDEDRLAAAKNVQLAHGNTENIKQLSRALEVVQQKNGTAPAATAKPATHAL